MSDRTCFIESCDRKFYARGWCRYHYDVARGSGRIEEGVRELVPVGATLAERLAHIGWTVTTSGCWEFRGAKDGHGYGSMAVGNYVGGKSIPDKAHWVAHLAWIGPIPKGEDVCHRCDNPPCINPAHLFAGARLVNVRDAIAKKRSANGERMVGHKLTDDEVLQIRNIYTSGAASQKSLGEAFGVCQQLISGIVRGRKRALPTHVMPAQQTAAADALDGVVA